MSGSGCLVSELWELSVGKPHPTRCPGEVPQATAMQPHLRWPTPKWWFLVWGVLQACPTQGSVVLLAQWLPQKLTSPGYPEPYVKGQESSTDIEAPEGYAVRLLFQDFDLEPSPDSVTYTQPINQATGGPKAIHTPGDNPSEIQSCCQEPYYEAEPSGTLTCTVQVPWKQTQEREEGPRCVPVCGRPVVPFSQTQESLGASRAELGSFPWQALTSIYGRGGGALLGDRWVLTAAHTIHPKDSILLGKNRRAQVFLGHADTDQMLELGGHPVRRVVVHPDYRQDEPHDFHGDIALLELERPPGPPPPPSLPAGPRGPVPARPVGLRQRLRRGDGLAEHQAQVLAAARGPEGGLRGLAPGETEARGVHQRHVLRRGPDAAAECLPGGQRRRLRGVGRSRPPLGGHGHRVLGRRVWQGVRLLHQSARLRGLDPGSDGREGLTPRGRAGRPQWSPDGRALGSVLSPGCGRVEEGD